MFEAQIVAALSSVTLNNGVTTLSYGLDLESQTDLGSDIGAYKWTVDPDGVGGAAEENFMSFNVPFNSGTQEDFITGTDGVVTNAVVTTVGCQVGTCMTFDGSGDYVSFADSSEWDFSDQLTVSFWFSSTDPNLNGQAVLGHGDGVGAYSFLLWMSGASVDDNASIYIDTPSGVFSSGCSQAQGALFNGTWHHYVGMYNRSTNQLKFYIDGAPTCNTPVAIPDVPLDNVSGALEIGRWPSSTSFLNGKVDEVQLYSRALSDAQIDRLYADGFAGLGGPTIIQSDETFEGEIWDLSVTPISVAGTIGSLVNSINSVTISQMSVSGVTTDAEFHIDVNDFLSFSIENIAAGDEPAGNQPFGAGAEITDLVPSGGNVYAVSGSFGTPIYTRLQTETNSSDGYNVIAYVSNVDGRTNTLLRSGGSAGTAADEITDSLQRVQGSQLAGSSLNTATDTGIAFRLLDASTSAVLRESDEDTQWGDGDAGTALWASFPLGVGAAQVIYDTLTYSALATTAYINWFVGISSTQQSGSYSGQITFTASVN